MPEQDVDLEIARRMSEHVRKFLKEHPEAEEDFKDIRLIAPKKEDEDKT